jgi:parallel beta-helix repeat protein
MNRSTFLLRFATTLASSALLLSASGCGDDAEDAPESDVQTADAGDDATMVDDAAMDDTAIDDTTMDDTTMDDTTMDDTTMDDTGQSDVEIDTTPPEGCDTYVVAGDSGDDHERVQEALIEISEGETLCFSSGTFMFNTQLSLAADGVTIRGAGLDATRLDFSTQDSGGNGIRITGDGVTFEDLEVFDTPGDGIRADDVDDITFRRISVLWPGEMDRTSGAYGLYPVGCTNVLIEDSVVVGARDAGIYVGQSNNIIVRRNEAFGNVAGIEIENSNDADVYENHAHNNTAGILIFNLPGLAQYGSRAKIHNNLIEENNLVNFGVEGTVVASVPGGTGLLILACDENEIHDNIFRNNNSFGALFFTYLPGLFGSYSDENFDVHSEGNWLHNNTFENNGSDAFGTLHAVAGQFIPDPTPEIVLDGCLRQRQIDGDVAAINCQSDNGDISYLSLDFCNNFADVSQDIEAATCTQTSLPAIEL